MKRKPLLFKVAALAAVSAVSNSAMALVITPGTDTVVGDITGTVTVASPTDLNSTLNVDGATTTNGIDNVGATVTDSAQVDGTLNVDGLTTTDGIDNVGNTETDTLDVTGASNLDGLVTSGAIDNNGLLETESLDVNGASNFDGLVTSGAVDNAGNLETETLDVNGASNLDGLVTAGALDVTGTTNLADVNATSIVNTGTTLLNGTVNVQPGGPAPLPTTTSAATPGEVPEIRDNGDGTSTVYTRNAVVTGSLDGPTTGGVQIETNGNVTLSPESVTTSEFEYGIYSQFLVDNGTGAPISATSYVAGYDDGTGSVVVIPGVPVSQPDPLDPTTWSIDVQDPAVPFNDILTGPPTTVTSNGNLEVGGNTTLVGGTENGITGNSDSGNLAVGGDTTLGDSVNDDTTVTGDLQVNGAVLDENGDNLISLAADGSIHIGSSSLITNQTGDTLGVGGVQELYADDINGDAINFDVTNGSDLLIDGVSVATDADVAAEASTRLAADETLQDNIDAEASTRLAADETLQSNIDDEASTRLAADETLQSNIDDEVSNRIVDVNAEESRAIAAEGVLTTGLSNEISNRIVDVNAEESRAIAAEGVLTSGLNTERSQRIAEDLDIRGDFAAADTAIRNEFAAGDRRLQNQIDSNSHQIDQNTRGIAMVAAMTNTTIQPGMKQAIDFNLAQFEGETGFGFGYGYRVNEHLQINAAGASTTDFEESVVRLGLSYQW